MSSLWVFSESCKSVLTILNNIVEVASTVFNEKARLILPSSELEHISTIIDKVWSDVIIVKNLGKDSITYDYASVLSKLISREYPELVVIPATKFGREIAALTSSLSKSAYAPEVVSISRDNGSLVFSRAILGGGVIASYKVCTRTLIATYRPSTPQSQITRRNGQMPQIIELEIQPDRVPLKRIQVKSVKREGIDLTKAKRIVAVGRGVKKKEDLALIEKLARLIEAEIGCTRILTEDYGWLPKERQIGLTGVIVAPELYIAIGISGQIQHVIGFKDSRTVIAINKDKDAPIHQFADYILVADLYEIVPLLIEKLENLRKS